MANLVPAPRLLAAPEVLHRGDGWMLWHTGIIDGPHGVQTGVEITDESGRTRVDGPDWDPFGPAGRPVQVTARQGSAAEVLAAASHYPSPGAYRLLVQFGAFGRRLGPRPADGGIELTIAVHPLGLRVQRTVA